MHCLLGLTRPATCAAHNDDAAAGGFGSDPGPAGGACRAEPAVLLALAVSTSALPIFSITRPYLLISAMAVHALICRITASGSASMRARAQSCHYCHRRALILQTRPTLGARTYAFLPLAPPVRPSPLPNLIYTSSPTLNTACVLVSMSQNWLYRRSGNDRLLFV